MAKVRYSMRKIEYFEFFEFFEWGVGDREVGVVRVSKERVRVT